MTFIQSPSGRYINLDHLVHAKPQTGGEWRVRWSDGTLEILTSTDGEAIRDAIKPKPSEAKKETKKESKPRGRPRKSAAA